MSDWFKWYEDALDEPRMQYAMHKSPSVLAVWVWHLSECSRTKSDTVRTPSGPMLIGLEHKLAISPGKFMDAIALLVEIDYVEAHTEHDKACVRVRGWSKLQSDYCMRKARKQAKNDTSVRTLSEHCPNTDGECTPRGEERRGEEKRKKEESPSASVASDFDAFWKAYPKKIGKKDALRAWKRAKDIPPIEEVIESVRVHAASDQWKKDGGQFIPNPATWINQGRWEDYLITTVVSKHPQGHAGIPPEAAEAML